jgi:hypothetical protein
MWRLEWKPHRSKVTDSKSGTKRWVNAVCRHTSVHKTLCLSISHPHHTLVSYIKVLARRCNEILQTLAVKGSTFFYPSIYRYQVRPSLSRSLNIHFIYKNLLHMKANVVKVTLRCLTTNRSWQRQRARHMKTKHNIHKSTFTRMKLPSQTKTLS